MKMARCVPLALAALLAAASAAAQEDSELRRCAQLADDAQRLACYDRAMARRGAAEPAPGAAAAPPAAETAPAPAAAAPERAAQPGTRAAEPAAQPARAGDAVARFGLPDRDDDEGIPREITATIVRIQERANGERIFTLDNGQVWVEDSPTRSLRLKEGDRVRIKSGLFGSYRLYGSGNRSTAVDRAR